MDNFKSRFVEMFGDPRNNDLHWKTKKLDELCTIGSSKRIYQSEWTDDGVPFYRVSDLVRKIDGENFESSLYIADEKYFELKTKGMVPHEGDILVTARGTLGKCYIVSQDDKFYFQDGMITWLSSFDDGVLPLYISYLFTMPGFRMQIDKLQAGSTVAYLSIAMAKNLEIMLPPIDQQQAFADFVASVDKSKLVSECLALTIENLLWKERFAI